MAGRGRDIADILDDLKDGELPTVLAIGGPERVLVDDALAIVRERALAGGLADFNHDRVKGRARSAQEIVNLARTLPTMAPRRLVEVHDADELGEDALRALDPYLDDPSPETTLVFVFGKFDKRQKFPKTLVKKAAMSARFEHPREREMPGLVRGRARRHKLKVSGDAAEALALTVGTDLGLLERAVEKLALVTEPGAELSVDDISAHVADTHLEDAFALGSAVAVGDRTTALRKLAALKQNRTAPLALMGMLAWQLRQVLRAREMLDEGAGEGDVTRQLKAYGARASTLMTAARRFDLRQHTRRLRRLAHIDRVLKFESRAPDWLWLERSVLELCPPQRPRKG